MNSDILEEFDEARKTNNESEVGVDLLVSGRELFDYRDHFNKWNNNEKPNFNDFALWCIHTKQGQSFIRKLMRV
jgi:hypothetical protein